MRFLTLLPLFLVLLAAKPAHAGPVTVIFEIQSPSDRFVVLNDQETTLDVLRKRLAASGVASPDVRVLDDNRFSVAVPQELYSARFVRDLATVNALALYSLTSVRSEASPIAPYVLRRAQKTFVFEDSSGKVVEDSKVLSKSTPVVSALRIRSAKAVSEGTSHWVEIDVAARTRTTILSYIKDNPAAALAISVDLKIAGLLTTKDVEGDSLLQVESPTAADARALAAQLNSGSLTLPLKRVD